MVAPITLEHPVFGDDFAFVRDRVTTATAKLTIPSPSMVHHRGAQGMAPGVYPDLAEFWADVTAAYRAQVHALAALGCTYLQLDDVRFAMLNDPRQRAAMAKRGEDAECLHLRYIEHFNAAVANRPIEMAITTHMCRGNFRSTWQAEGSYDFVAEALLSQLDVDGFFMDYDDERSGSFAPLRHLPGDKVVVLGLLTNKRGLTPSGRAGLRAGSLGAVRATPHSFALRLKTTQHKRNSLEADELLALINAAGVLDEPVSPGTLARAARARRLRAAGRSWKENGANLGVADTTAFWLAGRHPDGRHRGVRRAIVATLGCAGLRNSELCGLNVADLDFAHSVFIVRDAKTEAGIRRVSMTPPGAPGRPPIRSRPTSRISLPIPAVPDRFGHRNRPKRDLCPIGGPQTRPASKRNVSFCRTF